MIEEAEKEFAEYLCGISAAEIGALLSNMMRRENLTLDNVSGRKRVRKWRASLIGIDMKITEVNTNYSHQSAWLAKSLGLPDSPKFNNVDFHIENIEWEFKVTVTTYKATMFDDDGEYMGWSTVAYGRAKIGSEQVLIGYPYFEGDEDCYTNDMMMVRLMGLENDSSEEVML